jgi:hypothetical protein
MKYYLAYFPARILGLFWYTVGYTTFFYKFVEWSFALDRWGQTGMYVVLEEDID